MFFFQIYPNLRSTGVQSATREVVLPGPRPRFCKFCIDHEYRTVMQVVVCTARCDIHARADSPSAAITVLVLCQKKIGRPWLRGLRPTSPRFLRFLIKFSGQRKVKIASTPMLAYFRKNIALWEVPMLRPFVLLVRTGCSWRWLYSIGENDTDRGNPISRQELAWLIVKHSVGTAQ